jgi:DNA-binding SARP family transcriptional activator
MAQLTLSLLGGFQARLGSKPVVLPTKKAQGLLTYLAVRPGQPHSRDKLAGLLWAETGEDQARHSLRQTLLSLRKVLATTPPILLIEGDTISVDPGTIKVDVVEFEKMLSRGTTEALEQATETYRGDFLEGFGLAGEPFEEWLLTERERLWERALEGMAKLLSLQMKDGDHEAAIQTGIRLLALDPLQESVHRTLMTIYAAHGRRDAAARQYHSCVAILERELGVEPEQETKDLYNKILQDRRLSAEPSSPAILVVEDDVVTRALIEGFLTSAGYAVSLAQDGADALIQLGRRPYDAVLLDINVPTLDGLKILQIMSEKRIDTPAIFLTALPDNELETRGFELGAADFIRKPVQKDMLLRRISDVLRKARRAQSADTASGAD